LSDPQVVVAPVEQQVVVQPSYAVALVSAPGPAGPIGPQGPSGAAGGSIVEFNTLGVPMNPWVITHNFSRLVHVTIVGDDGDERFAEVEQDPPYNVVTIYFGNPFSGKALVG